MRTWLRSKVTLLFIVLGLLLAVPAVALASDLTGSVVDTTAPTGSVTLTPGNEGNIEINWKVTGKQGGISTFDVYKTWTLSGGTFTPSDPETVSVPARPDANAAATTGTVNGKVIVDSGQAAGGPFSLQVNAFNITNSDQSAKLDAGTFSTYNVTVQGVTDPCAAVLNPAAPVITATPGSPNGSNGWYTSVPSVSATTTTSGATIEYATKTLPGGTKSAFSSTPPTLGQGTTEVFAKATSATCNRVSESSSVFMVDTVAPAVNPPDVVNTTWRNSDLSQAFTSSDATSGLADATADASFTLTASAESVDADTPTVVSRTVSDVAGNSTTRSVSAKIDLTDPSVGTIVDNNAASSNVCTTSSAPTQPTGFNPSDGLSGINASQTGQTWTEPGTSTHPYGTYTYEAHATDNATNSDSYTGTYSYTYGIGQTGGLSYNGVLQPINMTGTPSVFKLGSTIPIKFTLACGQTSYGNAVANLIVKKSDSTVAGDVNEAISTSASTTGSLFRYDATGGQYIFNLSTKSGYTDASGNTQSFSAGTWTITIKFADGTTKTATFDIRK